jgi:4-hydroxy-tetrahydrodipicolinate synthase
MVAGGVGVISVASNIIPAEVTELVQSFLRRDLATSEEIHTRYAQLFHDLFIEPNPVPIKTALATMGICADDVRLPLCEMTQDNRAILLQTLELAKII